MKLIELHCGDSLEWMKSLPPGYVDLWITSPPYEDARSYSGAMKLPKGDAWVEWYIPYVVEMCRTSKTFAAVNVAGLVNGFRYSGIDQALVTDLRRHHGIVLGPSPYAWAKSAGIPGSGSVAYHRRDWEPVYLFAEAAKLGPKRPPHFSDNTAFGSPCKYPPGGAMSNSTRRRSGGRQNQNESFRRAHPDIANPGNVIELRNGGGHTGHKLTKGNEAPMSLGLAERFVRWFAPRGGLVGDPMMGSGTTLHAALKHGRRAVGCDLRPGQMALTRKRLATVRCES